MQIDYLPFSLCDYVALITFFTGWIGYHLFASKAARNGMPSLMSVMARTRQDWWSGTIKRDLKIVDANIILTLSNGATFFASTTILILGALLALLGTADRAIEFLSELPFSVRNDNLLWDYKIILLLAIFVYAFFKFTWSLRQHTFCSVMVGSAPEPDAEPSVLSEFVRRGADMASEASNTFNDGLRAYYFGLSVLTWFVNPILFIVATLFVITVLYRREFKSQALRAMMGNEWRGH